MKKQIKPGEIPCVVRFHLEAFSSSAFISVDLCSSVDSLLPHERQLRGAGAADGLEIRDRVTSVETHSGPAILHTGSMPGHGNRLHASGGDGVLRGSIRGIRADAKVNQRGVFDRHAHTVDGRNDRGP